MKTRIAWVLTCLIVFGIAEPILAHGWANPPPPPPPPPPYTGMVGGGTGAGAAGGPAETGGGPGSGAYNGPSGGGAPADPNAGSSSSSSSSSSSGGATFPRPTAANRGGTTLRTGVAAPKAKKTSDPWVSEIHVDWNVGFLPAVGSTGYGTRLGTVADALRMPVRQGGWDRDDRPVMVLAYDASDADQRRVIEALDADSRVRAAAQFFSCFRVDVGAKARKGEAKDARLSVYTSDGTLVGEVTGQRRISGVYDLLETAWAKKGGTDFAARVANMDALLKIKAHSAHYIPLEEVGIVCPDCGGERHDILEKIAAMKARSDACERMMADLRVVARK